MNHWATMLADTPVLLRRLIARTQRISLPRGADASARVQRLRTTLCRQSTVRAAYATLTADERAALHQLRHLRGGLSPDALQQRFGPLRSLSQITADPRPQSTSERLLLLGWLVPRPPRRATRCHPSCAAGCPARSTWSGTATDGICAPTAWPRAPSAASASTGC